MDGCFQAHLLVVFTITQVITTSFLLKTLDHGLGYFPFERWTLSPTFRLLFYRLLVFEDLELLKEFLLPPYKSCSTSNKFK